mmetsp:Transcript_10105/g.15136  ORF Transcript_10105/g.15136 Transcript_10105/m.15136 type:complete len:320 (+) Transcript_10105:126-1085(+)
MKKVLILVAVRAVCGFNHVLPGPSRCSSITSNRLINMNTRSSIANHVVQQYQYPGYPYKEVTKKNTSRFLTKKLISNNSVNEGTDMEDGKKTIITGYTLITIGYFLIGFTIAAKGRNLYYGTGPFLTAGLAHFLKDASLNGRLSSITYKRLNLVLVPSTLLSSIAGNLLINGFHNTTLSIEPLLGIIAVKTSIQGYLYGLRRLDFKRTSVREDLKSGWKASIRTMTILPNFKSALYFAATCTTTLMAIFKFLEIIQLLLNRSKTFMIGTRLYRFSKLLVLATVCFTLKDAADRERLEEATFVKLNFLLSFVFAAMVGEL